MRDVKRALSKARGRMIRWSRHLIIERFNKKGPVRPFFMVMSEPSSPLINGWCHPQDNSVFQPKYSELFLTMAKRLFVAVRLLIRGIYPTVPLMM